MGLIGSITPANLHTTYPEPGVEVVYADIYLSILDSTTGQSVNGNNAVVDYRKDVTGVITNLQQAVPGQSVQIYSGIINQTRTIGGVPNVEYYVSFLVTGVGQPNPSLPVNICDLSIDRINIDAPESAPGAHDAQITVVASSSYPIQYSLDNITFQSSPTFSGLASGLQTVYVIDENTLGCAVNQSVTIPVTTGTLINDPAVTIGNNESRWNAAFNPIVFTYQRKDYSVTGVTVDNATNKAKVAVNTTFTDEINDKSVYINAGPYKGAFKVKSFSADSLVIDTPYVSNASGFININQLKPYYKVLTRITYQDPITGQQNTITSTNRPDNTGLVKADLSNFLQSLLRAKDESNYTQVNYRDTNLSASYQIEYAESWGVGTNDHVSDWITITDPYYVIYTARQLGDKHGGNLAAYVPFKTVVNGTPLAKWITDFVEPVYSNNYPFDLGFIYSEDLAGLDLYAKISLLDINKDLIGGFSPVYLLNEDSSFLLNQDGSKLIIADAPSANVGLAAHIGLNRFLVDHDFNDEVYYFTIGIYYTSGATEKQVIADQLVRVDKNLDHNSVYLRWIGLTGSWNYYRFTYNQDISLDVQNATIIKNYVLDWENQDGIEEVIGKSAGQKMKVYAEDISVADIKGLQSIKYSPKVQMLVNKNPVKWQTVVLNTATFSEYETLNGFAPFSVTFNLPSINIQTQ